MLVPWTAQAGQSGRTDYANGMEGRSDGEQWPPLSWKFQSEAQLQRALLSRTLGCYSNVIIAKHHILKTLQAECTSSPPRRFHFSVTSFGVTKKIAFLKNLNDKGKKKALHKWGRGSTLSDTIPDSLMSFSWVPAHCGRADAKRLLPPPGCIASLGGFRIGPGGDLSCV